MYLQAQLAQGRQTFSVKDQIINILGFMAHMVTTTTIQLYCCS